MTIRSRLPVIGGTFGFYWLVEAQARLVQLPSGYGTKLGESQRLGGLSPRPHHPMSAMFALRAIQV